MRKNKTKVSKGFTLIETLISVVLIILVFAIGMPVSVNFYKSFILQSATETAFNSLKKARLDSQIGNLDSGFGVYFDNNNHRFIYFKGQSYASRDQNYDQVYDVPQFISFSGSSEFGFQKITGKPNTDGEVFMTNGLSTNSLKVEANGKISFQKNIAIVGSE